GLEEQYAMCVVSATLVSEMTKDEGPTQESLHRAMARAAAVVPRSPGHPVLALAETASNLLSGDMEEVRRGLGRIRDHDDPWVRAVVRVILAHLGINYGEIDDAAEQAADGYARF